MGSKDRIKILQSKTGVLADGVIGNDTIRAFASKYNTSVNMAVQFFANVHHESWGFTADEENLNYSTEQLLKVFPKYFDSITAKAYAHKPESIANIVYGGRMGNTHPGDGWKFRGRGAIQTTGKVNYRALGNYYNVDLTVHPELVATALYWDSAIFYFKQRGVFNINPNNTEAIRKAINGGLNGIEDVKNKIIYYKSLLK